MQHSPEIHRALALGWVPTAADLVDAGSHNGYQSPDGKWFLLPRQLVHLIRTGCAPSEVPTETVLPD